MGNARWDEKTYTVRVGRTEFMDNLANLFRSQNIVLPKESDVVLELADHLSNVIKKFIEDPEGVKPSEYKYVKRSTSAADHWFHSLVYAYTAASKFSNPRTRRFLS